MTSRPRRRTVLALAAALVTAVSGVATGAAPASAAAVDYVQLGDSYSAGPGAGDYAGEPASCYRSRNSYGALFAASLGAAYVNDSCSGATVPTVRQRQGGNLTAQTDVVTLTIGGNDVGFSSIVAACRLGIGSCTTANENARTAIARELPASLRDLVTWLGTRAPNARLLVTGYPIPYNATATCLLGVSKDDRARVNETIRRLNAAVSAAVTAVARQGVAATYVSVTERFEGNRLCDRGTRFINDLTTSDIIPGVYHPSAEGHRLGYLPAVQAAY